MHQFEDLHLSALRAVVALLVVFGHARGVLLLDGGGQNLGASGSVFYVASSLGHQSVIVFFVLSGYWVGGATVGRVSDGSFRWLSYLIARFSRLWIVLVPALVLTLIADETGLALNSASQLYAGGQNSVINFDVGSRLGATSFLANTAFFQSFQSVTYGSNGALWSLAYEFWFYVLFPAILLLRKGPWLSRAGMLVVVMIAVSVGGLQLLVYFPVWLLGAFVARMPGWTVDRFRTSVAVGAFMFLLLVMCIARQSGVGEVVGSTLVAVATAIFIQVRRALPSEAALPVRALARLSHSSYTLYAIHLPLIVLAVASTTEGVGRPWSWWSGALVLMLVSATCAVAWLIALVTERRTDLVRRRLTAMGGRLGRVRNQAGS